MKIHILTGVFFPELHPRAFRAHELAKEFSKQGHNVTVSILTTVKGFDYENLAKDESIQINLLNLYTAEPNSNKRQVFSSKNSVLIWLYRIYRLCIGYFIAGNLLTNSRKISRKLKIESDCDLMISLSTPFMNLYGTALYRKKHNNQHTVFVADSGDPFYYSQQAKHAFYFRWLEKWVYKYFDFLAIPTENAIPAYGKLLKSNKIKIIPQGFDFNAVQLVDKVNNERVTFAFAGVFYQDIRNPEFLLKYLSELDSDFMFKVYLRYNDPQITVILDKYQKMLGNKLEINYGVSREKLIYELSSCDFLINIGNTTSTQLPSKLIDYGITKRPFYSCIKSTFDKEMFEQFLKRDYSSFKPLDISKYSINVVTSQFLSLIKK